MDRPQITIDLLPINQDLRRSDRLAQGDMVLYATKIGTVIGGSFDDSEDGCVIRVQYIMSGKEDVTNHHVKRSGMWRVVTMEVDHP